MVDVLDLGSSVLTTYGFESRILHLYASQTPPIMERR